MKALIAALLAVSFGLSSQLFQNIESTSLLAHSGGTDKCGCHTNRSTGQYHCHTRKQRGGDCPPQAAPEKPADENDNQPEGATGDEAVPA